MKYIQIICFICIAIILGIIALYIKSIKFASRYYVYQYDTSFNINKSNILDPQWLDISKDYKMQTVHNARDANIVFFTDYALIDTMLPKLTDYFYNDTFIYGFAGQDQIAHKALLAIYIRKLYPEIIPKTYILFDNEKVTEQAIYFIKKNIQRQEGNFITDDIDYINDKAANDSYVVAQELIQDVYLINKRKINMRFYLLVCINNSEVDFYIYRDGFMYYTPDFFEKNSLEKDKNITTGYIDRQVYIDNPLTHDDFYKTLSQEDQHKFKNNVRILFEKLKKVYKPIFKNANKDIPGYKFNILGVDIAPKSDLDVLLIEVNKYPSLQYMDKRDRDLKYNMLVDMFTLVKIVDNGNAKMFEKMY